MYLFILQQLLNIQASNAQGFTLQTLARVCPTNEVCGQGILPLKIHLSESENNEPEEINLSEIKNSVLDYLKKDGHLPSLDIHQIRIKDRIQNTIDLELDVVTANSDFKPSLSLSWGYNRSIHSKSNVTFNTSSGKFTVENVKATDRPVGKDFGFVDYVNPSTMWIPQYNMKLTYKASDKLSFVGGMDHMKYVFDHNHTYKVTGHYNRPVFDDRDQRQLDWEEDVLKNGNVSWLRFEHTDGYNYAYLGVEFDKDIIETKNKNLKIEFVSGLGLGLMIPRTQVAFHQDNLWSWQGLNNKFKVAGGGIHGSLAARVLVFKNFFIQGETKGTVIKVHNALVDGTSNRFSQTPIASLQGIATIGYRYTFKGKK